MNFRQKLPIWYQNEPRHDKTNKMTARPAKTRISLGIRPVSSESLLCAQWVAKDPSFLHAGSEDPDQDWVDAQADLSLRWAHTHFVGFVMSWLRCFSQLYSQHDSFYLTHNCFASVWFSYNLFEINIWASSWEYMSLGVSDQVQTGLLSYTS